MSDLIQISEGVTLAPTCRFRWFIQEIPLEKVIAGDPQQFIKIKVLQQAFMAIMPDGKRDIQWVDIPEVDSTKESSDG